jgi:malonate transporter and related proteins
LLKSGGSPILSKLNTLAASVFPEEVKLLVFQSLQGCTYDTAKLTYVQSLIRFNTYIGLSIATTLGNAEIKSILVNILAIAIPVVNVVSILSLTAKNHLNISNICLSLIKNPLISSCILGIAFNVLNIPIWSGFVGLLNAFSSSSLMLGLLCVGTAIQLNTMRKYLKVALVISILRLLIIPLIT